MFYKQLIKSLEERNSKLKEALIHISRHKDQDIERVKTMARDALTIDEVASLRLKLNVAVDTLETVQTNLKKSVQEFENNCE